jgi:hypothetical protein
VVSAGPAFRLSRPRLRPQPAVEAAIVAVVSSPAFCYNINSGLISSLAPRLGLVQDSPVTPALIPLRSRAD